MWLINTEDYSLQDVQNPGEDYSYAILSHTWDESDAPGHREVAFNDMRNLAVAKTLTGWPKIEHTCDLAKRHQPPLRWAWIDTCCIDKSSSAELTEAINSMFRYYREATVCFVHLSDVPRSPTTDTDTRRSQDHMADYFRRCRWLSRGWTLQELIAPKKLVFLDQTWTARGTKQSLEQLINSATDIDVVILRDSDELETIPVGRRMSWASKRDTTRVEDLAYCLFGIFDVNMPLIYGEGEKAFLRLQHAIAQQSPDLSLFAWDTAGDKDRHLSRDQTYYGMFAKSPRNFACCKQLVLIRDAFIPEQQHFNITNRGIEFKAALEADPRHEGYLLNLFCQSAEIDFADDSSRVLAVRLLRTLTGFVRHRAERLAIASSGASETSLLGRLAAVHIPTHVSFSESLRLEKRLHHAFRFRIQKPDVLEVKLAGSLGVGNKATRFDKPQHAHFWDPASNTLLTGGYPEYAGVVWPVIYGGKDDLQWSHNWRIVCGLDSDRLGNHLPATAALDLYPWVAIIAHEDACIRIQEHTKTGFFTMLDQFSGELAYGPTVSLIGARIRQQALAGIELSTQIELTAYKAELPWEKEPVPNEKLAVRLQVEDVSENGVLIHEVIMRLEPVNGATAVPIREVRRRSSQRSLAG